MKNYLILISFILFVVILTTCTIKEPQAPEWDIKISIPLIDTTYYMSDFADTTDDFIFAVENDTMQFSFSGELDTMMVGDELKISGQTESFNKQIGDELKIDGRSESFSISVGDSLRLDGRDGSFVTKIGEKLQIDARQESFSVSVGDSLKIDEQNCEFDRGLDRITVEETGEADAEIDLSEAIGEVQELPIPAYYDLPPADTEFAPFPSGNIEYVVIDSGFAYIDLTNDTEIPLSSDNPNHYMKIEIYGNTIADENRILVHEIDHIIQAQSTESIELDLSDCKVYMTNWLRVYLTTDGTGTEPASISEGDVFVVKFGIGEMTVTEASAKLPAEYINHNDEISIQDNEIQLTSAKIDSCLGNIQIENNLPISANVIIQFEELFDTPDHQAEIALDVPANASIDDHLLDFSGYEIKSEKQVLDTLHFSYFVMTDSTDGFVSINKNQKITTRIELNEMWFEEVSGYVNQSFEHQDSLSIEDEGGEIILQEAVVRNGDVNIQLTGLTFTPEINIVFTEIRDPNGISVELTNDDFNYYDFANHSIVVQPDQIVHYTANVNTPADEIITITSTDNVSANINLGQFIFETVTGTVDKSFEDTGSISIMDESGEISIEFATIESGSGDITIHNSLPFAANGTVTFAELYDGATPYSFDFQIDGDGDHQEILDLAGFNINSETGNLDSLHYDFEVATSGEGTVNYADSVYAEIELGEMFFEEITGEIHKNFSENDSISAEDSTIVLQSAEIKSGKIDIQLTGLELSAPTTIRLLFDEIKDPQDNPLEITLVENFNNFEYDFVNHRIEFVPPNQTLNYHTTVVLDQEIEISNDDVIQADITLSDLIFESITGEFGSFTLEDSDAVEVDSTGEFSLFYAKIDSCDVTIEINEEDYSLPFDANINIVFQDIFDAEEDTLQIDLQCPGDTVLNFSGYTIGSSQSQTVIDFFDYSYSIETEDTGEESLTINYDDDISASITIGDMIFQEITGVIDHKRIDLDDMDEEIDMGDFADSLQGVFEFQYAELQLEIDNGIGFNCDLNLHLTGENNSGENVQIDIEESIIPGENTIIITEGIPELLNILPTHIKIQDSYTEIYGEGTITKDDSISGSYTLQTPLKFIINDYTMKMDSLQHIEIEEDTQDVISENLNSTKLFFSVENTLPLGTGIKLYFANDSTQVWEESEDTPYLIIDSLSIQPADTSEIEIILDETDETQNFDVFLNPDVYLGVEFSIIGTNGEEVTILGNDNIRIFGRLEVNAHISDTLLED